MTCSDCGHEIVDFRTWERLTTEERTGKRQRVGTCCRRCYDRSRRPPRRSWPLRDLIEEAEFLFVGGESVESVAFKLGLKPRSLIRQYQRARAKGLTDRHLTDRGSK